MNTITFIMYSSRVIFNFNKYHRKQLDSFVIYNNCVNEKKKEPKMSQRFQRRVLGEIAR